MVKLSLVIPIKNESRSIEDLIKSIDMQTAQPDEIIFVDGGSTDDTVDLLTRIISEKTKYRIVKTAGASPGAGRNIGAENAKNEWLAFTDAGIRLEADWIENLTKEIENDPLIEAVFGNYSPVIDTFFAKCATFAYVAPQSPNTIRSKCIPSSMIRKEAWKMVGGFPDLRAAEDLIFMEAVESEGVKTSFAPKAMVHWELAGDLLSTFNKFCLYSKHNALAGRTWDWHYGIAKQYLFVLILVFLAVLHDYFWLTFIPLWMALRTAKRIINHRFEFGYASLMNPFCLIVVGLIILTIDIATFIGWGKAQFERE